MWSVQVTGSLRVLNPAACTALIRVWLGAGFPQLVTLGLPSKELPRFQPGGMTLTTSCGVRAPEELELEELELDDELETPDELELDDELETPDELELDDALETPDEPPPELEELETPDEPPLLELEELLDPAPPVSLGDEPQAMAPREAPTNPHLN